MQDRSRSTPSPSQLNDRIITHPDIGIDRLIEFTSQPEWNSSQTRGQPHINKYMATGESPCKDCNLYIFNCSRTRPHQNPKNPIIELYSPFFFFLSVSLQTDSMHATCHSQTAGVRHCDSVAYCVGCIRIQLDVCGIGSIITTSMFNVIAHNAMLC